MEGNYNQALVMGLLYTAYITGFLCNMLTCRGTMVPHTICYTFINYWTERNLFDALIVTKT